MTGWDLIIWALAGSGALVLVALGAGLAITIVRAALPEHPLTRKRRQLEQWKDDR